MPPRSSPWIIWFAVLMHVVWGVSLLLWESVGWITAVHTVVQFCRGSTMIAGILLIACGVLAGVACIRDRYIGTFWGLALAIPQQFLMMISAVGAVVAACNSSFADGVVRPRPFIFNDQFPSIAAAILHTFAILEIWVFRREFKWPRIKVKLWVMK